MNEQYYFSAFDASFFKLRTVEQRRGAKPRAGKFPV
jgi:hypothetical protein